jgi:Fibrillar collagen C-terminal domain
MPRSCHEIHSQEPSKDSGHYWVDPDGPNTGDDPVPVYCNMAEGSTLISHDKAEPGELTGCIGEGCQQQRFHYYATINQLTALVQRSVKCSQDFEFMVSSSRYVFNHMLTFFISSSTATTKCSSWPNLRGWTGSTTRNVSATAICWPKMVSTFSLNNFGPI